MVDTPTHKMRTKQHLSSYGSIQCNEWNSNDEHNDEHTDKHDNDEHTDKHDNDSHNVDYDAYHQTQTHETECELEYELEEHEHGQEHGHEQEQQPIIQNETNSKRNGQQEKKKNRKTKQMIYQSSIVLFCTVSILLFLSTTYNRSNNNSTGTSNINNMNVLDAVEIDPIVYPPPYQSTNTNTNKITTKNEITKPRKDIILPLEQAALIRDHQYTTPPFSTLNPVKNLAVLPYNRYKDTTPGKVFGKKYQYGQEQTHYALPTNKWYENMILLKDSSTDPLDENQVYTVPYVVGFNGPVSGIKLASTRLLGMDKVVQVTFVDFHSLNLGAAESFGTFGSDSSSSSSSSGGDSDSTSTSTSDSTSNDNGRFGHTVERRYAVTDDDDDDDGSAGNTESDDDVDITNTDTDTNRDVRNKKHHTPLTPLGITIKWNPVNEIDTTSTTVGFKSMSSSIVRGMPYGTMNYRYDISTTDGIFHSILPTVVSKIQLSSPPIADSKHKLNCYKSKDLSSTSTDKDSKSTEQYVEKSVKISFLESDITWLVFYSHPVYVRCYDMSNDPNALPQFVLQATRLAPTSKSTSTSTSNTDSRQGQEEEQNRDFLFTSRIALMNNCTLGKNPSHCTAGKPSDMSDYETLLEKHADVYPGQNTKIDYTFFSDDVEKVDEYTYLQFDWDARHVRHGKYTRNNGMADAGLLMFSLPHHREIIRSQSFSHNSFEFENGKTYCTPSLNGNACIVDGSAWVLKENLDGQPSFFAPRPPMASTIPNLANAINQDMQFRIPEYFSRGAGDTYFSGKILAKLSRILLVAHELKDICSRPTEFGPEYVTACKGVDLPSEMTFNESLDNLRTGTEIWINGEAETPFVYDDKWGGMCSCGCYFNSDTKSCDNAYPNCPAFADPGLDFGHAFYNDHHFHQGYHIYAASTVAFFDNDWGRKYFENVLLLVRDIANPSPLDEFFPIFRMKDWYLGNSWAGGIARAYPNGRNQESSSESIAAYEAITMFGQVMANIFGKFEDIESKGKAEVSRHVKDVGRLLTATEIRSADRYWHVRQTGPKSGIYPPQYKPLVVGIMWNMMAQFQTWFGSAPHLAYGIQLLPLTPVSERRDAHDWVEQLYPSFAKSCSTAPDCKEQGWGILQHAILAELGHPSLAIEYAESLPGDAYESAGGNGHSLTNTIWYYATRPKVDPIVLPKEPSPTPFAPASPSRVSPKKDSKVCPACTKDECNDETINKCPALDAPFVCTGGRNRGGCSMVPWNLGNSGGSNCNQCCQLTYNCQ